jgi:anti-sigma factor ChrR (cupin superfamily)
MNSNNGSRSDFGAGAPEDRNALPACRWQESLALHALGSLAPTEIPGLIEHLASGCQSCVAERARLEETLAIMDVCEAQDVAALPTPRAGLRARLLQEIESSTAPAFERSWQHLKTAPGQNQADGISTSRAGDEGFERTGIEGIEVKPLHVDAMQRRVTMLIKMAPGTSYPAHRHATSEECFVVSGDIRVGDRVLHAGDYQVAPEGTLHGVQSTEKGCVLFIVSSQDDELV